MQPKPEFAGNPDGIFSTPIHLHQAIFDDNIDLQKEADWLLSKVEQKGFEKFMAKKTGRFITVSGSTRTFTRRNWIERCKNSQ